MMRKPKIGDVYAFMCRMYALSGSQYDQCDTLTILGRTDHGLRVQCKDRVSLWTNVEMMLEAGQLRLVSSY